MSGAAKPHQQSLIEHVEGTEMSTSEICNSTTWFIVKPFLPCVWLKTSGGEECGEVHRYRAIKKINTSYRKYWYLLCSFATISRGGYLMKELNCRGLACPQPVLNTKQALEEIGGGQIRVIVDNEAARDNVRRFATSQACEVSVTGEGSDYVLTVAKSARPGESRVETTREVSPAATGSGLVVKISNQFMGTGDEELGRILIKAFIKTLSEATRKPRALVFYNSGVHLAVEGSEHLEAIKTLHDAEVDVLVCGTCLDFFGLKEKLAVGRVSNMFEIIETLSGADRIVSP